MLQKFVIGLEERAVVSRGGLPVRALGPGRHWLWGTDGSIQRYNIAELVFDMPAAARALLPSGSYDEITLAPDERAIVWNAGRPARFLGPGTHRYWTVDDEVRVQVLSTRDPMPPVTTELAAVIPSNEYEAVTVHEHERGLLYVQGRFVRLLSPGRYTFWSTRPEPVTITTVDMRTQALPITGQEVMTRDKVSLRLSLSVEYGVDDPVLAASAAVNVRDTVYVMVQLASRQFVGGATLDELLTGRDAMSRYLEEVVTPKALRLGIRVEHLGVKDVVLPGEMKAILNKVIEAEKEAAANVILRREETAATRSLANTAKLMAEQPLLLRLKELESLKEMAEKVGELRLVVGANSLPALRDLVSTGLLTEPERPEGS